MLADLLPTSQWNSVSITAHAKMFADSTSPDDVLVLKFDMDAVEVLALLRPKDRDHFTLVDLTRGFQKIGSMIETRSDRLPCASVSFLGAASNQLKDDKGEEPTFESVLRTMFDDKIKVDEEMALGREEIAGLKKDHREFINPDPEPKNENSLNDFIYMQFSLATRPPRVGLLRWNRYE